MKKNNIKPNTHPLRVGIIGLGMIGTKRFNAIQQMKSIISHGIFDVDKAKSTAIANIPKIPVIQYPSYQALLADPTIEAVVIATPPHITSKIVRDAFKAGKHVLAEKPLGNTAADAAQISRAAQRSGKVLKAGFNHRHHPAIMKAHELFKEGAIGNIMYIRAVYGHGGRKGYGSEWRMQKKFSRGGELYDQGVHVIDLANWFIGEFDRVFATTRNLFWKKSDLEDNAFCQMLNKKGQVASFHASVTQWKNKFSFEIFGTKGYLFIDGLGRSYGTEKLTVGIEEELGKPYNETIYEFPGEDISWREELTEFERAIATKRRPMADGTDNVVVMKLLEGLYRSAKTNKILNIKT